ncbi:hypothetical protein TCAL_07743, partial [Tigriopus californicus]
QNEAADALSRHPVGQPEARDVVDDEVDFDGSITHACTPAMIRSATSVDPIDPLLQDLKSHSNRCSIHRELKALIQNGFPNTKSLLSPSMKPYWRVRHELTIDEDALLSYCNTLCHRDGKSPAEQLFDIPIRDGLPAHRTSFGKHHQIASSQLDRLWATLLLYLIPKRTNGRSMEQSSRSENIGDTSSKLHQEQYCVEIGNFCGNVTQCQFLLNWFRQTPSPLRLILGRLHPLKRHQPIRLANVLPDLFVLNELGGNLNVWDIDIHLLILCFQV